MYKAFPWDDKQLSQATHETKTPAGSIPSVILSTGATIKLSLRYRIPWTCAGGRADWSCSLLRYSEDLLDRHLDPFLGLRSERSHTLVTTPCSRRFTAHPRSQRHQRLLHEAREQNSESRQILAGTLDSSRLSLAIFSTLIPNVKCDFAAAPTELVTRTSRIDLPATLPIGARASDAAYGLRSTKLS
jgi:hypothetical protein